MCKKTLPTCQCGVQFRIKLCSLREASVCWPWHRNVLHFSVIYLHFSYLEIAVGTTVSSLCDSQRCGAVMCLADEHHQMYTWGLFFQVLPHRFSFTVLCLPLKSIKSLTSVARKQSVHFRIPLYLFFKIMRHKPAIVRWDYTVNTHMQVSSLCVRNIKAVGG